MLQALTSFVLISSAAFAIHASGQKLPTHQLNHVVTKASVFAVPNEEDEAKFVGKTIGEIFDSKEVQKLQSYDLPGGKYTVTLLCVKDVSAGTCSFITERASRRVLFFVCGGDMLPDDLLKGKRDGAQGELGTYSALLPIDSARLLAWGGDPGGDPDVSIMDLSKVSRSVAKGVKPTFFEYGKVPKTLIPKEPDQSTGTIIVFRGKTYKLLGADFFEVQ
jgi:hypothetical protein